MSVSRENRVTIIPAEIDNNAAQESASKILRVAAYCRVSTNLEAQKSSYKSQLEYYLAQVMQNPQWSLVKIYADRGKETWGGQVIRQILQNEKYVGDAMLQKTFVEDLFTRRSVKNTGQLPKYYVHDCHAAIIDKETFYRVQEEIARRASIPKRSVNTKTMLAKYSSKYALSEKVVCGNCGGVYRRISWRRPEGVKVVWRCLTRLELGKKTCSAPTVTEEVIQQAVVDRLNCGIDRVAFTQALLAAANEVEQPDVVVARLDELLDEQWPPMQEYDDEVTRHLLKRVVVKGERQVEVLFYSSN